MNPPLKEGPDPRFPLFLLYVRWKYGVTFVRRCFSDGRSSSTNKNVELCLKSEAHMIIMIHAILHMQSIAFLCTSLAYKNVKDKQ